MNYISFNNKIHGIQPFKLKVEAQQRQQSHECDAAPTLIKLNAAD